MSRTRAKILNLTANDRGEFVVECTRCDSESSFPDRAMAIIARNEHLCWDNRS